MTIPWARESLLLTAPNPEDAEIEALQTDVMRFMAILGFILSVIFALVQSLPFIPKNPHPTLEHYESLQIDIANLNDHIQSQLSVLEEIKKEIRELDAAKKKSLSELTQITQQQTHLVIDSRQASEQLKEHQHNLATIERQVEKQDKSLRALQLSVERERQELRQVQKQLTRLRDNTLELRRQHDLAVADTKAAKKNTSKAKPVEPVKVPERIVSEPVSPPKRIGFTLKFKSDKAFNRLLARNSIEFYVLVGDKAWRTKLLGETPKFVSVAKPKRFHEMDQFTVPQRYVTAFKRVVAAHGRISGTWGVILPASISQTIQAEIRDKQGGDVIIDSNGKVRLESPNP